MSRRLARVAALLLASLLLTGCWDSEPINDRSIVTTLAVDAGNGPGNIRLTEQIPSATALTTMGSQGSSGGSQGGSGSGSTAFFDVHATAADLAAAVALARTRISRDPYFGEVQNVVLGPGLDANAVAGLLDAMMRLPDLGKGSWMALSPDRPASSLIDHPSPQDVLPALYIDAFFKQSAHTGLDLRQPVWQFYVDSIVPGLDPFLPILDDTPHGLVGNRIALYRHDHLAGLLTPDQTIGWAIATSKLKQYSVPVQTPWGLADVRALAPRSSIRAGWVDGRPRLSVRTRVQGIIGQRPPRLAVSGADDRRFDALIQRDAAARLRSLELDAIAVSQRLGVDPFGFGSRLYAAGPRRFKSLGSWGTAFARLSVAVDVTVLVTSQGDMV